MRFHGLIFSLALTSFGMAGAAAQADEPWKDCADFTNEAADALLAVRSCSDAIHVRRNIEEADAVCKGADALSVRAADAYEVLKADTSNEQRSRCAVEHRATAVRLVAAFDWLITYKGFRLDRHRTPMPKPFAG